MDIRAVPLTPVVATQASLLRSKNVLKKIERLEWRKSWIGSAAQCTSLHCATDLAQTSPPPMSVMLMGRRQFSCSFTAPQ
jgi:hypothetical protein